MHIKNASNLNKSIQITGEEFITSVALHAILVVYFYDIDKIFVSFIIHEITVHNAN